MRLHQEVRAGPAHYRAAVTAHHLPSSGNTTCELQDAPLSLPKYGLPLWHGVPDGIAARWLCCRWAQVGCCVVLLLLQGARMTHVSALHLRCCAYHFAVVTAKDLHHSD